ncbi:MAG: S8 family serine peptidase, partial [Dehalococcoidia bacterium]
MRFLFVAVAAVLLGALARPPSHSDSSAPCAPVIESVTPDTVFVGGTIVIQGVCLAGGATGKDLKVSVGAAPIVVGDVSATEIVAQVNTPDLSDVLNIATADGLAQGTLNVRNWTEPQPESFRAGAIEVKLKPGIEILDVTGDLGGAHYESMAKGSAFPELSRWWRVQVEGDTITRVREWAGHEGVEWAQPDMVIPMQLAGWPNDPPDDTCYPDPTPPGCDVVSPPGSPIVYGDDGQWGIQRISVEGAWAVETGDPSVRIAVMDTGVDIGNPSGSTRERELYDELGARVVISRDFTGTGALPSRRHGTNVAGIAAATTNNATGVAGVAPGVEIVSYKVYDSQGTIAPDWYFALLVSAIDDDVGIVNMSFGGYEYDGYVQTIINAAHAAGIVMVATAGNLGFDLDTPGYFNGPAEYNHVLTVAATDSGDQRGNFYPPLNTNSSNYGSAVEISAPGVDILSTNWLQAPEHQYYAESGTSFAAPMVSGVAALLASRGFYGCEIVETITGYDEFGYPVSADPISWQGGGVGRLNAEKALQWWGGGPIVSNTVWPNSAVIHAESNYTRYVVQNGKRTPTTTFNERNDQCIPAALLNSIPLDSDGDGWTDDVEAHVGTDPLDACGFVSGGAPESGTWPVDFVESNSIN